MPVKKAETAKVAILKLCGKTGGVRAVPAVTAYNGTGKSGIARSADQQRPAIQEAGVIQKLRPAGYCLRCLRGVIGVGGHALAGIDDFNTTGFAVFDKGIL